MSRKVFLAVPHMGAINSATIASLFNSTKKPGTRTHLHMKGSSALTLNFNQLWCEARTRQKAEGFTHFAMIHADVAADAGWIDTLIDEMEAHNAGVLSAVIPIKDRRGVTTTAIGRPGSIDVARRLTVREARKLPKTFTAADAGHPDDPLLINTGCWVCDLTQPWVKKFPGFTIVDAIVENPETGECSARFFSEDWYFGLWLHTEGVKVVATTAVPIGHYDGNTQYRNDLDWGLETDPTDGASQPAPKPESKPVEPELPPGAEPIAFKQHRSANAPPTVEEPVPVVVEEPVKPITREIVAVRFAESLEWLHDWLDELLVKNGPNLTYWIYDKGSGGDTPNIGNLDWTYLHHIVTKWDDLADWTVFTQADPFPHLGDVPFDKLLKPGSFRYPFLRTCREWNEDGRLAWNEFPEPWNRRYKIGAIRPAKLSLAEWFKEYLDTDIFKDGFLNYHPGAIFGVSRLRIQTRPKSFYERLLNSLGESRHPSPEEAHYCERAWPIIFGG